MFKQLSTRIFALVFTLLCIVFFIFTFYFIQNQNKQLMNDVIYHAVQASDLIKRSTQYSMMQNRKQDAYHIINTIALGPGYEGIRIFGKAGNIIYSTDSTEVGQIVDMSAEACNHCHIDGKILLDPSVEVATRIFTSPKNYRILGLITPIHNSVDCSGSGCHEDPDAKTILGVLDVKVSLREIDNIFSESKFNITLFFIITILLTLATIGIFVRIMVHKPIKKLILGTREISQGNLDHTIDVDSKDEIGELAVSFNKMTHDLKNARQEVVIWSNTLEKKVDEKTRDLKRAQSQIIHVEKMASLGKLSASVAHEINNPLTGILTYTSLLIKNLNKPGTANEPAESGKTLKYLQMIKSETSRCGEIVTNLLLFARKDKPEKNIVDIKQIMATSIMLVQHHIEMQNINLITKIPDEIIRINCKGNTIQQAIIAVLVNAVESMDSGGELEITIDTKTKKNMCTFQISDTGHGIPEDILPNIFEPFFTTKDDDKGVGLGLSVVYGIMERHKGSVKVDSVINEGTTVILELPMYLVENNKISKSKVTENE